MPTYQYACTECDQTLEQFQSFSDDALTVCPSCEGRLRKVYNAVGVVFKGSGFYRNDSRTDGKSAKPAATSESAGSTSSDSGSKESGASEKKTDTKAEKKSESTSAKASGTSTSAA